VTDEPPPWDAGLQNERTTLAWLRSALSFVAAGMLVANQVESLPVAAVVLGGVLLAAGGMVGASERRHRRRNVSLHEGRSVVSLPEVVLAAGAALGLAGTGLVLVVT
jgi:uncharacterized membrane protein YidH (DUF202 family)